MLKFLQFLFVALLLLDADNIFAQLPVQDTVRKITIFKGRDIRQITINDSTVLQTLAGDAMVSQGNTTLSGDSIVLNQRTGIAEVFGNVHVNDADSVNTYANYLRYVSKERIAYLKKNVKLTDGKGTLLTDDLVYNIGTGIATYQGGGKVLNGKTVLTSADAVYYSNTKDVYFKKYVHLVDPKYDIVADSLLYNTQLKEAHFIAPTRIKTPDNKIVNTTNGVYNLDTGESNFFDRTSFSDSGHYIIANKIFNDDKKGISILEGNAKVVDSLNKVIVLGDRIERNSKDNSFLATQKPVMIFYDKKDSTYLTADTLFSGLRKYDTLKKSSYTKIDTVNNKQILLNKNSYNTAFNSLQKTDSLKKSSFLKTDTLETRQLPVTKNIVTDTLLSTIQIKDTLKKSSYLKIDTLKNKQSFTAKNNTDTVRYFIGIKNVKIFNDSAQAVSDSLYYSTEDSVFRLFKAPILWNGKSQITGDTMYLFTEKQNPKRLYVFNNSVVVNQANPAMYNQAGGRTLNAYFVNGEIDYTRIKGSPAETIFYPQDEDSAYIGMNRSSGDVVDVYFVKKEVNKIKFINNVDGTLYPLRQVPPDKKYLRNFKWQDKRRPKNKLELFE